MIRLVAVLWLLWPHLMGAQGSSVPVTQALLNQQAPAAFEENKGQVWDEHHQIADGVRYHYKAQNAHIFMLPTGMAYQFSRVHTAPKKMVVHAQAAPFEATKVETYRVDMTLVGANPKAKIVAEDKSSDYTHYYNRSALSVYRYGKLTYQDIYPGIDWVIYTTPKGLKYDFIVHPHADPNQIQLRFTHQEAITLQEDGSLDLTTSMGTFTEQAPISYQGKKAIKTAFHLDGQVVQFELEAYDKAQTLIIDPYLIWGTYYGEVETETGEDCAVDGMDNVYLSGVAFSNNQIAAGGHQTTYGGIGDLYLVKFNSAGVRQWATYYGTASNEEGGYCATDGMGNV